ncbi:MAG: cysC [Frankiales bacterium]|jgi:adenylylsulfate kinase|nr:cysC [Frankiales bacterium]
MTALDQRPEPRPAPVTGGATLWLTGLPSAGKTTLATALAARLRADGVERVEVLDGDEVREFLSKGLGFTREDRDTNVLRIGWVAASLARHGVLVLASVISPFAETRAAVRELHGTKGAGFLEVHVATPVEVCSERDVKGLYAKQASGEISGLTGVDAPYEAPTAPDLRVPTQEQTLEQSVDQLHSLLTARGLL